MNNRVYTIQNLKCGGCAHTIITKLNEIPQIENVQVIHENSQVTFDYKEEKDLDQVKNTLRKIGYPVEGEDNNLMDKAKSYVSCAIGKMKT